VSQAISRRNVLTGLGLFGLAGCSRSFDMSKLNIDLAPTGTIRPKISVDRAVTTPQAMYASLQDGPFVLPAIPYEKIPREYRRQIVQDPTGEAPGTIVVSLQDKFLYLVQPGGEALRYGVGIGKDGFIWSGRANIQYKREWPTWTPPREMIARKPEVAKWAGGQPGGLDNPLGARALYIFKDGVDTQYRVQAMSSGCVRMINQDVIDLYNRVQGKAPIVVG
jgi:lipoprotein-anchoring transpeptidase ErfK/SrfK